MTLIKLVPTAAWDAADEVDVVEGDDLFPLLAEGTYRPIRSDSASVSIPALTAGTVTQTEPKIGNTITVTGSNVPDDPAAVFLWEKSSDAGSSWVTTGMANNAAKTFEATEANGVAVGDLLRRTVTYGVHGPVTTPASAALAAAATTTVEGYNYTTGSELSTVAPVTYLDGPGALQVVGSELQPAATNTFALVTDDRAVYGENQFSQIEITGFSGGTGREIFVVLNAQDNEDIYFAVINAHATREISIVRRRTNNYVTLMPKTQYATDTQLGIFRFERETVGADVVLRTFFQGVQIGTDTVDADPLPVGGKVGYGMKTNGSTDFTAMRADNFEGGDL